MECGLEGKENRGQGNWETGFPLMEDKDVAWRNDSGLEEGQRVKKYITNRIRELSNHSM